MQHKLIIMRNNVVVKYLFTKLVFLLAIHSLSVILQQFEKPIDFKKLLTQSRGIFGTLSDI